jgi:NIMA (never in mitosis gene a)-related kinase
MVHIAKGLRVLHHHNVIHRDLKSANIFITGEGVYKLADLNISKILKESLTKTQTGTPYYCSPEIWKEIPYGSQSDMWSLGCVLYEMASGKPPFAANDIQGLFKKICSGIFPRIP